MDYSQQLAAECRAFIDGARLLVCTFCQMLNLNPDLVRKWLNGKSSLCQDDLDQVEDFLLSKEAQELLQRGQYLKTVSECVAITGIRHKKLRKLCESGVVKSEWDGRKFLVYIDSLYSYIQKLGLSHRRPSPEIQDAKKLVFGEFRSNPGEYWVPINGNNPHDIFGDPNHYLFDSQYWVSNYGRIFNATEKSMLCNDSNAKDHVRVQLKRDGNHVKRYLHIVTAYYFCDNRRNVEYVHHINGDAHDNCASNLIWVTAKEHRRCHKLLKHDPDSYKKYLATLRRKNKWN